MNPRSVKKRIFRLIMLVFSFALFLLMSSVVVLHINRDKVNKRLFEFLNENIHGEITYKDLEINPFVSFPHISVTFNNLRLQSLSDNLSDSTKKELIMIEEAHVSFDILRLLRGEVNVTRLKLEQGKITIQKQRDGNYDIQNALMPHSRDTTSSFETDSLSISLKYVLLKDIAIKVSTDSTSQFKEVIINESALKLDFVKDHLECDLSLEAVFGDNMNANIFNLTNEKLQLNTKFDMNVKEGDLTIEHGQIILKGINVDVAGKLNYDKNTVDLNFESFEDFELLNQILTSEGVKNIKKGNLYLNGSVAGNYKHSLPQIVINLGAENFTINIPNTDQQIANLFFNARFESGNEIDLSQAHFWIDTLRADMPDGSLLGVFHYSNFQNPQLTYKIDLETSLNNLHKIIDLGVVQDLSGRISIKDEYKGKRVGKEWTNREKGYFTMDLDSVSFAIANDFKFDKIDGTLSGVFDSINIDHLQIVSGNNDLLLDGRIENIRDLFSNLGRDIYGNIEVKSNRLNLNDLPIALPDSSVYIPTIFDDLTFKTSIRSNYAGLLNYTSIPSIKLEIQELTFKENSNTNYRLFNTTLNTNDYLDSTFNINLHNSQFNTDFTSGSIQLDFIKLNREEDSISLSLKIDELDFDRFQSIYAYDSFLTGNLKTNLHLKARINRDSIFRINNFSWKLDSIQGTFGDDSIDVNEIKVLTSSAILDTSSPIRSLNSKLNVVVLGLNSPYISQDYIEYNINVDGEEIVIIPAESSIYGKVGKGKYVIWPFKDPPELMVDYYASDLPVQDMITTFHDEDVVKGKAELKILLQTSGIDKNTLLENLKGQISLTGSDLLVYGFNVDKIIRRFERTQKFSLLDIAAVAVAGPVGLAVTKGSNYANMIRLVKSNDSTSINALSSNWNIEGGKAKISDVAFSTSENRLAAKGWIDFTTDSIQVEIAALDKNGCAILKQELKGTQVKPKVSGVKIIPALIAPVTKLFTGIVGKDCEVFYEGNIPHPE